MIRIVLRALSFSIVGIGVYGALALWYHPPFGAALREATAAAWLLFSLLAAFRALRPAANPTRRRVTTVISAALIGFSSRGKGG